jgi:hypothetical protein
MLYHWWIVVEKLGSKLHYSFTEISDLFHGLGVFRVSFGISVSKYNGGGYFGPDMLCHSVGVGINYKINYLFD